MTKEEALAFAQKELQAAYERANKIRIKGKTRYIEVLEMAIQALSKEPCEDDTEYSQNMDSISKPTGIKFYEKDAVSREAVISKVKELFSMGECYCDEHAIVGMINELPSVTVLSKHKDLVNQNEIEVEEAIDILKLSNPNNLMSIETEDQQRLYDAREKAYSMAIQALEQSLAKIR